MNFSAGLLRCLRFHHICVSARKVGHILGEFGRDTTSALLTAKRLGIVREVMAYNGFREKS